MGSDQEKAGFAASFRMVAGAGHFQKGAWKWGWWVAYNCNFFFIIVRKYKWGTCKLTRVSLPRSAAGGNEEKVSLMASFIELPSTGGSFS